MNKLNINLTIYPDLPFKKLNNHDGFIKSHEHNYEPVDRHPNELTYQKGSISSNGHLHLGGRYSTGGFGRKKTSHTPIFVMCDMYLRKFALYDTALTQSEVKSIYLKG